MHVHFHLIPKHADGTGLPHAWPAQPIDHTEAASLARQIAAAIEKA
jgi:diadenosine tetraphosphate (Ap4A) HIT family hydrolase